MNVEHKKKKSEKKELNRRIAGKQTHTAREHTDVEKFNLIIIIIQKKKILARECLFLFAGEMEVILAIIILLCAHNSRFGSRFLLHIP